MQFILPNDKLTGPQSRNEAEGLWVRVERWVRRHLNNQGQQTWNEFARVQEFGRVLL